MYIFEIKDDRGEINVAVLRSLYVLAAITVFFYHPLSSHQISGWVATFLLLMAIMMKTVVEKLQLSYTFLLILVGVTLLIGTFSLIFSVVLLLAGFAPKLFYRKPEIQVNEDCIVCKKMTGTKRYQWRQFENVILKDNLLTLDFSNNKVLQLEIVDAIQTADEYEFKLFCERHLKDSTVIMGADTK